MSEKITGPGRCPQCEWHPYTTGGHAPGCTFIGPMTDPNPPHPQDGKPWLTWMREKKAAEAAAAKAAAGEKWTPQAAKARYDARHAAENGEAPPEATAGRADTPDISDTPRTMTRTPEEIEAYARGGINKLIGKAETDPPGKRNDQLNKRALRGFRLALLAGFDLDDVHDAFVDACHVNRLIVDDGINSVRGTLRSARKEAVECGPAPMPRNLIHVEEFDDEWRAI